MFEEYVAIGSMSKARLAARESDPAARDVALAVKEAGPVVKK